MKKKLATLVTSLVLVGVLLLALCGCSTYNSILKAYQKKNYEEVEASQTMKDTYTAACKEMFGEDYEEVIKIHVLNKKADKDSGILGEIASKLGYVVIVEFKSTKELNEKMKKHVTAEDAKDIAEQIQKLDNVSGNCVYLIGTTTDGYEIFKSTK